MRWPPLWMMRTLERSYLPTAGSLISRVDPDLGKARARQLRRPLDQVLKQAQRDAELERRIFGLHAANHRLELEVALPLGIDAGGRARELDELVDLGEAMRHERGDR